MAIFVYLAINRSMFCFCLNSQQPSHLLSCYCDAVVHVAAVKTPHNPRVCLMCAFNYAKMQKRSSQAHDDTTDSK